MIGESAQTVSPKVAFLGLLAAIVVLAACSAALVLKPGDDPKASADFRLWDSEGQALSLSDYRGKIVLVLLSKEGEPIWGEGYAQIEPFLDEYAGNDEVAVLAVQQRTPNLSADTAPRPLGGDVPLLLDPAGRLAGEFGTHGLSAIVFKTDGNVAFKGHVDATARTALQGLLGHARL